MIKKNIKNKKTLKDSKGSLLNRIVLFLCLPVALHSQILENPSDRSNWTRRGVPCLPRDAERDRVAASSHFEPSLNPALSNHLKSLKKKRKKYPKLGFTSISKLQEGEI